MLDSGSLSVTDSWSEEAAAEVNGEEDPSLCMHVCMYVSQSFRHCKSFLIHTFYLLLDLIVDRLIPCTFPSAVHNETLQSSCGSLHIHTKVDCSTSSCFQKYPVQADVLHREIKLLDREEKKSKISSRDHTYSSLDT